MNRNLFYGTTSTKHIETTKSIMQQLCNEAMKIANQRKLHCPDFGISRGLSTAQEQFELYKLGREQLLDGSWLITNSCKVVTNCDGFDEISSHQSGYAIDFFAIIDGKANYEPSNLALIATCFFEAASNLGLNIDWGGSYKSISDAPHIEIII